MSATVNATLAKLKERRLALGLIVKLHTGVEMAKVAKACDHDFLYIDMQHGGMSIESVIALCHAALDTGVTPLVRVPIGEASTATRVLDNGAMGIIAPNVDTAEDARTFVKNCRFAPLGKRSVGAGYPQLGYVAYGSADAIRLLDAQTMLVAMIESESGVRNAMEIAAVPGIDVIHIGSNDLLTEMGLSGEMGKQKHFALAQQVLDACRKHGKIFGIGGVRTPEIQSRFIAMGARMMTTNSDIAFLMSALSESARAMRSAEKQSSATA
jgi:2-keto-3-deoxy-L-rhamnonate aldolase RhmA